MAYIVLGIGLAGAVAMGAGYLIMEAEGRETMLSAPLIGIGLFAAILALPISILMMNGIGVYNRVARGENAIARWTLTPDELATFRELDAQRTAHGPEYVSDYIPPETCPPGGLSVIFVADAVMIGDIFYGLTNTGLVRFDALKMLHHAKALEFRLRVTTARGATVQRFVTESTLLRVPIAPAAMEAAAGVQAHFEKVLRREVVVNPGFWPFRIRVGLWTAVAFGAISAIGYSLWDSTTSLENPVPEIMMGGGAIFAIAGLILALAAWVQYRRQMRR
jgi:hypothetical protein